MKRLEILSEQIKQVPPYVDSCFDYLNLGSLLTHEENVYFGINLGSKIKNQTICSIRSYPNY